MSRTSSSSASSAWAPGLLLSSAPSAAATPPFGFPPFVTIARDEGETDFALLRHITVRSEAAAGLAKLTTCDRCFEALYGLPKEKPRAATGSDTVLDECSSAAPSGFCAHCRSCPPSSASWRRGRCLWPVSTMGRSCRALDEHYGYGVVTRPTRVDAYGYDALSRPFSLIAFVLFSRLLGLPPAPPERRHGPSDRLKQHKPSIGRMSSRSFCGVFYRLLIRPFCLGDFSEPSNATEGTTAVRPNKRAESNIEPCKRPLQT